MNNKLENGYELTKVLLEAFEIKTHNKKCVLHNELEEFVNNELENADGFITDFIEVLFKTYDIRKVGTTTYVSHNELEDFLINE